MTVFLALLAVVGWALSVSLLVSRSRQRAGTAVDEPRQTDQDSPAQVPVDSIIDSLPLGVVVVDADGHETFRNAAVRDRSIARHEAVLIDAVIERLSRSAVLGESATETIDLVGPPFRVLVINAIPSASNGAVITVEDISERSRLDQVRTDFVANVSHELKTPIGAISILAETLEGETDDEDIKNLVRRMVAESHRMSDTIDDLLELSRVQLGGDLVLAPVDMNDVVTEALERSRPLAQKRGITLVNEPSTTDATIQGDRFQLLSAIGNLVDNAIKYSDDNATVTALVRAHAAQVEVEVIDQGIGIPVASIDRIFERFYRVDRARSRGTGGTGLGLSIVRHVVTNHGGEVNVRSREGEGSRFTVGLPRRSPAGVGTIGDDDERAVDHG